MIYFVRHGESVANREGYFAGKIDSPLTDKGERQAAEIGEEFRTRAIRPARIITSSLLRAQHTSVIIADIIGHDPDDIEIDGRFDEYDFGSLTGQPRSDVDSERFMAVPDREEPFAFYERIRKGWNEWCGHEGDMVIVSHSFVRVAIECALAGGDLARFHEDPSITDSARVVEYHPTQL